MHATTPTSRRSWLLWLSFALPTALVAAIHQVEEPTGKAVQSAIDACAAAGGGVVYLPPGRYVSGPLWMKDNVELRVEAGATVVMSHDRADWPAGVRALVNARGVKRIAITGRGTFDGNAQWEYVAARGQDPEIIEEQELARQAGVEMKRYYRKGDVQKYLFVLQDFRGEAARPEGSLPAVRKEGVTVR
jgi:polygalacturonase